ncbi:MAG: TIGR04157 family glycosyltransferase [Bacteroidaceae bacterium]|nr:TIGR04157 family glycosyltransferase [Bacteroidaceae bacterium]
MKHYYLFNNASRAAQYGIGTYLNQLCNGLKEEVSVSIIAINSEEEEVKRTEEDGVCTIHIPEISYKNAPENFERYYRNLVYLLKTYIDKNEEAVFVLNYLYMTPLVKLLHEHFPNCKVATVVHYLNWCFALNGNVSKFHQLLENNHRDEKGQALYKEYQNDRKLLQEVDKVVCLSQSTRNLLIADYQLKLEKTTVIYNGLKDEGIMTITSEERKKLKQSLSFDAEDSIILFVGRLDSIKGVDFLIKAFRKVLEICPHARLLLAGDGDYNAYLKECNGIRTRITFTGKVKKEELYQYYQIADVGVMPSFHEQCSYVGIEMMMHGVPLIGTNSTGLGEMTMDELKVELDENKEEQLSVELLANKIIKVLTSQQTIWREASRKRYERCYTQENMKKKYLNLFT